MTWAPTRISTQEFDTSTNVTRVWSLNPHWSPLNLLKTLICCRQYCWRKWCFLPPFCHESFQTRHRQRVPHDCLNMVKPLNQLKPSLLDFKLPEQKVFFFGKPINPKTINPDLNYPILIVLFVSPPQPGLSARVSDEIPTWGGAWPWRRHDGDVQRRCDLFMVPWRNVHCNTHTHICICLCICMNTE